MSKTTTNPTTDIETTRANAAAFLLRDALAEAVERAEEDTTRKVALAIGRERFVTVLMEAMEAAVARVQAARSSAK